MTNIKRVAIIEDDPAQIDFIRSVYRNSCKEEFELETFNNPLLFLGYVKDYHVDIAIIDISLADGVSGFSLVSVIKYDCPDIEVWAYSGSDVDDCDDPRVDRLDNYITKEGGPQKLMKEITDHFKKNPDMLYGDNIRKPKPCELSLRS